MQESGNPQSRTHRFFRVLRPLFLWFALVLILFGIHEHQVWLERTRIYFDLTMDGKGESYIMAFSDAGDTAFGATAAIDGTPIRTSQRIPLGHHTFTITQPKAETYSTNLFIWYGPHNFGTIDLKRAKGMLTVNVSPPAPLLFIRDPEASVTLTNSPGIKSLVPTDEYTVTAQYDHWQETHSVKVFANTGGDLKIEPRFGVLDLTCSQKDASFQLNRLNGTLVQTGDFPAQIPELPAGTYQLVTWHHNHKWIENATVVASTTNSYRVDPQYGAVALETAPAGAVVVTEDGRELGTTPLTVNELQSGKVKFNLRLNNYEPCSVALEVTANQTQSFHTNLTSQSYTSSMRAARQSMNAREYDDAVKFLTEALRAQPDDAAASALLKQAENLGSIGRASALGKQGEYIAGIKELEKALTSMPDDEQAKKMLADFKQHEPEQRARMERENSETLTNVFHAFTDKINGSSFVEMHEMTTAKSVYKLQAALAEQFNTVAPVFRLTQSGWTNETFFIDADQEVSGGGRLCMIVGTQIKEGETRILFKNIEYKSDPVGLKILGAILNVTTTTFNGRTVKYQANFHPIDPTETKVSESDKTRLSEGNRIVSERIQHAIENAVAVSTNAPESLPPK
jgi:tetratricopeptide (TPR) repeat protein